MANKALQTEVGKWLQANGAVRYARIFYDKGFEKKKSLSEKIIYGFMKDKPGLAAELVDLLDDERKAAAPKEPKTPPPIPALPKGTTLDITMTEISAPDVPPFSLPKELSVDENKEAVVSPHSLL
jgi:hypothetical protein